MFVFDAALKPRVSHALGRLALFVTILATSGCIVISRRLVAEPRTFGATDSVALKEPLKLHLRDGATIIFRQGALVSRNSVSGLAIRYSPTLAESSSTRLSVPLDSVVAAESFSTRVNRGRTVAYTILNVPGMFLNAMVACVLFADDCFG